MIRPKIPRLRLSNTTKLVSIGLLSWLWEMNDFLFLLLIENVRPTEGLPSSQVAWFTFIPETWRGSLVSNFAAETGSDTARLPFLLARVISSIVYLAIALGIAIRATAAKVPDDPTRRLLEAAFLTLAWFWLLLPTQNPWYLVWCLPLLPFARGRAWLVLSGFAFGYYLRFWFTAQFSEPILGTPYSGSAFFDYIVTWIEFGP